MAGKSFYFLLGLQAGTLRYFYLIALDFSSTFQSYLKKKTISTYTLENTHGNYYIIPKTIEIDALKYDLSQPVHGAKHFLNGVISLIFSPFLYLKDLYDDFDLSKSWSHLGKNALLNSGIALARLLHGAASLIVGLFQVATTPLTYLFKIPMRFLLKKNKIITRRGAIEIENKWEYLRNTNGGA